MTQRHIFDPVLSHRFGLPPGIDLVPFKTCSYDCAYCECGHTTTKTVSRQDFFPACEVMDQLREVLAPRPPLDSVTLAGSGEPTFARSLGPVIASIKHDHPAYTISVLTSGSLLKDPDVQEELLVANRVIPTLTAAFQKTFEQIHNPPAAEDRCDNRRNERFPCNV